MGRPYFLYGTVAVSLAALYASAWNAGFPLPARSLPYLLLWLLFWCVALGSVVYYFLHWRRWPRCLYPSLICASTLLAVIFLPFDRLSRELEFRSLRADREAIVGDLEAGRILPVTPPGGLALYAPHRTIRGHEIALLEIDGKRAAFFYTWKSSDDFEGWLYVPPGADPAHFQPGQEHRLHRHHDRWYYFRR